MKQNIKILLLILSIVSVFSADTGKYVQGTTPLALPKYKVNLDLSYEERWREVITTHKQAIQNFWKFVESMEKIKQIPIPLYQDKDFLEELQAISKVAGVEFKTSQVVSQMYELLSLIGCTSIVARNSEGKIFHARNLDYAFESFMTPMLAQIEFQSQGKTVYSADMIVGTVFVLTGVRNNGYSITINQRYGEEDVMKNFQQQYIPAAYLIHKVLRTQTKYEDAVKQLKDENIVSIAYFIVAGTKDNEGTVIERNHVGVNLQTDLSNDTWFLVQTNFDRKENDEDGRRTGAEEKIAKLNKNFEAKDLFQILSEKPNFVKRTITTDIMIPSTGYLNSVTWWSDKAKDTQDAKEEKQDITSIGLLNITWVVLLALFIY